MSYRPFSRRKKNKAKNQEAVEIFNTYNRLAPTTRVRYNNIINDFSEFLLIHKKSLWDTITDDIRKYFLDSDTKTSRTVLTTFYRILIQADYYKRTNPMELFFQEEKLDKEKGIKRIEISTDETANVLQQLDESDKSKQPITIKKKKREVGKRIITNSDLDKLLLRVKSIRDRTILIFLFATGIKLKELTNLLLSDVDIEARQVTIRSLRQSENKTDEVNFRTIILPRRTISYLKIYERWRKRILSPVPYYFITTRETKKQMSESAITNWLKRIQRDRPIVERWTAMDFRKRALLQQYWITRDLTSVARFGGYKRPESALRLIAETLAEQGVDSIEKLGSGTEFEKSQKTRTASVSDLDNLSVTIELQQEDLDFIASTGQTPTQLIRSLLRYRGSITTSTPSATPGGKITEEPLIEVAASISTSNANAGMPTPGGTPKLDSTVSGGPNLTGGPDLGKAPSGGSNLDLAKASSGPNLTAGPDLSKSPASSSGPSGPGGQMAGAGLNSAIKDALGGLSKASGEPSAPQSPSPLPPNEPPKMTELQALLARRRKMNEEKALEIDSEAENRPGSLEAVIKDVDTIEEEDKEEDEEEEIPELPDFS